VEKYYRVRQASDDKRRMCGACWIPKATDTHSEYAMFPAFARQQRLRVSASKLRLYVLVLCYFSRPAGPTTNTAWLSPRYEGKTRGCHCSHWAIDGGRENARNMLSCT